jgi:hypothetical protein
VSAGQGRPALLQGGHPSRIAEEVPDMNPRSWSVKVIALHAAALPLLFFVYWKVTSRGIRFLSLSNFGQKLYRGGFDVANVLAVGLLFFSYVFSVLAFQQILTSDPLRASPGLKPDSNRMSVLLIAGALLLGDAAMFFLGAKAEAGWGGAGASTLKALIATLLYLAPIVGLGYYSVYLSHKE